MKLAVIIGRFQPPHRLHIDTLLNEGLKYDRVLVLLGSAFKALDQKNPFSPLHRELMIERALKDKGIKFTFDIDYLKDYPYSENRWVLQVQKKVNNLVNSLKMFLEVKENIEITLIGTNKDESSYYLKLFPQWNLSLLEPVKTINATDVRIAMFENKLESVRDLLYPSTFKFLEEWIVTPEGKRLQKEYLAEKVSRVVLAYKSEKGELTEAKYKPISYCTDNVVTWRGHVLMIRRRSTPGQGLWALPGGHLNPNEWIKTGAMRELQEETHIYFYTKENKKRRLQLDSEWCRHSHEFDYPERSRNGRKITRAFHWVIPDEYEVSVQPDDDADRAQWFTFYQLLEEMDYEIFEDHQSIIAHMVLGS